MTNMVNKVFKMEGHQGELEDLATFLASLMVEEVENPLDLEKQNLSLLKFKLH